MNLDEFAAYIKNQREASRREAFAVIAAASRKEVRP